MKQHKGVRIMAVAALAALGLTAACSTSNSPKGTGPAGVTSMFGSEPDTVINVNTNQFTKLAEKKFGLKFAFSTVPSADVATKQSLLLSSGKYPDIIWNGSITPTDALKYGQQGVFVPIENDLKKYAPNAWNAIQTVPGYKQDVTAPDGHIYALPAYNFCFHCFWTDQMWINAKDLKQYSLPMPQTTAEFEHDLEVFKQHGITPLSGALKGYASDPSVFLMNSFLPYNGPDSGLSAGYVNVQNGKVIFAPTQPQWQQGLQYMSDLYSKGLLPKEDFTQDPSILTRLVTTGKTGAFPGGGPNTVISDYGAKGSNYQDWLPVPPLKGPSGAQFAPFEGGGFNNFTFAVTNHASSDDISKIFKLINYMYTPTGAQTEDFGPAGKYWTPAKKGQQGLVPKQALFNTNWNAFYSGNSEQNSGWNQWGPIYQSEPWRNLSYATPPFSPSGAQTLIQLSSQLYYAGKQPKEVYPPIAWVDPTKSQQFGTEQTNITNYVESWKAQFITGQKSPTSDWNAYVTGLKNLGLSDYLTTLTKAMGKPLDATASMYQKDPADIQYLLRLGSVPAVTKKYLIQTGVPASDFKK